MSANAIRQRVQKIKNQAKLVLSGDYVGNADNGGASTTPKSSGKRKVAAAIEASSDATPAKKRVAKGNKGVGTKDEDIVKTEVDDKV